MNEQAGRPLPQPFFAAPASDYSSGRRLVLISYHFPPSPGVGALRWQKFSRYFSEKGWELDVFTLDPAQLSSPDPARLEELPAGMRIFAVPEQVVWIERLERILRQKLRPMGAAGGADGTSRNPNAVGAWRQTSFARSELRWNLTSPRGWVRAYGAFLDFANQRRWALAAIRTARAVVQPGVHRAIISCGPPHMSHEASRRLARHARLPFILDMRDPWSLLQRIVEHCASPLWLRLANWYESRVVEAASLIVTNTEPARRAMSALYPQAQSRIITVMNGQDEEPYPASCYGSRFVVAYAGSIYLDRDPRLLFRAAARVIADLNLTPAQFGIEFVGSGDRGPDSITQMVQEENLNGFFRLRPPLPRRQALEFLASSAVLVSLPQDSDMAIPSKVFEYLGFSAWLLALAKPGSATELVLRDRGADVVDPDDVEAIAAVLRQRYQQFAAGVRPTSLAGDGTLSRRHQAQHLIAAVEQVVR